MAQRQDSHVQTPEGCPGGHQAISAAQVCRGDAGERRTYAALEPKPDFIECLQGIWELTIGRKTPRRRG